MAAAVGILDDMRHHPKPVPIQQQAIFGGIEAGVIQGFASVWSYGFSCLGVAGTVSAEAGLWR